MENSKQVFSKEPDKINEVGTKFWKVTIFDHILEKIPVEGLTVMWSEYVDPEGEGFYAYVIIEDDEVAFEAVHKRDIKDILHTVLQESVDRGLIELEME